jgi:hypothetical protein
MQEPNCFFCYADNPTIAYNLGKDYEWPFPIPKGAAFAMCQTCADTLSADEIAEHIRQHINNERAVLRGSN